MSEITDNVLNHADSHIGGILQVMTYPRRKVIEIYVCDTGMGIHASLRQGRPDITDPVTALSYSIREGVTRNRTTNQGNGLFGAYRCSELSNGEFSIVSGNAYLKLRDGLLHASKTSIPARGAFIRTSINYAHEELLEKAFVFQGQKYDFPYDYIEKTYHSEGDEVDFKMVEQVESFGSREAGRAARTKIENVTEGFSQRIMFDFDKLHVVSSSFADEVYAKIFKEIGPQKFGQMCRFKNIDRTVKNLINRSIIQRSATPGTDEIINIS